MAQQEWLYGLHAMQSVLEKEPERVMEVLVLKGRNDERLTNIVNQARRFGISVQFCQRKALDDKVSGEQHQGVIVWSITLRVCAISASINIAYKDVPCHTCQDRN